jgi:hypothetical protein
MLYLVKRSVFLMSETSYKEALTVAKRLIEQSDEALFEELGLRIEDMKNIGGYERSKQYSAEYAQVADDMLSFGDLKEIGRRWWQKIEQFLMELLCDQNKEDLKQITQGKTIPEIAAGLATAALVSALAPPAWVIVATTILAAKIAKTGLDSLCEVWRESTDI